MLTMKHAVLAALLLAPLAAQAQQPKPDPTQMALGQTLTETLGAVVQWRARAIADEQKIAALEKQIADAKKPATAAPRN